MNLKLKDEKFNFIEDKTKKNKFVLLKSDTSQEVSPVDDLDVPPPLPVLSELPPPLPPLPSFETDSEPPPIPLQIVSNQKEPEVVKPEMEKPEAAYSKSATYHETQVHNVIPQKQIDDLKLTLEKLDILSILKERETTNRLDNLKQIHRLSELEKLQELSKINEFASYLEKIEENLKDLDKLDSLKELGELSKLDQFKILKEDKVLNVIERLENLPIIQKNMKSYIIKSFLNSFISFAKILIIMLAFFYILQTSTGQIMTVRALEIIGFDQAAKTNFALEMIATNKNEGLLKATLENTILKAESRINEFSSWNSEQLVTIENVNKIYEILNYNFSYNNFKLKEVILKKIDAKIESSRKNFYQSLDYSYEKDLISETDLTTVEKIKNDMKNKNYSNVIKQSKTILAKDYKFVLYALQTSILELSKSDFNQLIDVLNSSDKK